MTEQQIAAVKQALEYIEATNKNSSFWLVPGSKLNETVTALRRILADHALDKMAENARELGLDYEPVALNQGVPPMLPQQKEGETFAVSYEQPADEPVALQMDVIVVNLVRAGINKHHARELAEHFIKHVRPQPAAQWVGLTDEEIKKLAAPSDDSQIPMTGRMWVFVGDIEAKLKEKNT